MKLKERPILFRGPMVRAILEGRKTQTRRIVKPQLLFHYGWASWETENGYAWSFFHPPDGGKRHCVKCPHGKPGDRLWVRETAANHVTFGRDPETGHPEKYYSVMYRADETDDGTYPHVVRGETRFSADHTPWRPSIFMPRWASRITLEITEIRIELLGSITEAEAIAEGFGSVEAFQSSWEKHNGEGSWAANPWVWVITFNRIKP